MSWGNRYFEFDEPVRWFKAVGLSESNTWIGSSRVFDTVYEPTTVNPGDVVHALVGGTFLVRKDGQVETGRFNLPKSILEKTYGMRTTDQNRLEAMAKAGRCREVPQPSRKHDYNSARKAVDANKLPPLTGAIPRNMTWPNSPNLDFLLEAYQDTDLDECSVEINAVDVGMGSNPESLEASLIIDFGHGHRISISSSPIERSIFVRDDFKTFGNALKEADFASLGLTPEFRNDLFTKFPESEVRTVMQVLGDFLASGHINVPEGVSGSPPQNS